MGYYTHFSIVGEQAPSDDFLAHIRDVVDGDPFESGEPYKWYEHEEHIANAMRATGTGDVKIHGEGEEQGDVWDKTFHLCSDGSVEIALNSYVLEPADHTTKRVLPPPQGGPL